MESAPLAAEPRPGPVVSPVTPAPQTAIFDPDDFANWALADLGMKPATVKENTRRLRAMQRKGFNVLVFLRSPEDAKVEVRSMLAAIGRRNKPTQFRNCVKVVNWLARYAAMSDARFKTRDDKAIQWSSPNPVRRKPVLFTPAEIKALRGYGHAQDNRTTAVIKRRRALVWLCLDVGLRRSEIARINLADIDAAHRGLHIPDPAKGGKPRLVPLAPDAFRDNAPLQAWMRARYATKSDALWIAWVDKCGAAFPMTVGGLSKEFAVMSQELGFRLSFNRFRHYHASELVNNGLDIRVLKDLYGHASLNSTAWYTQLSDDTIRDAVDRARTGRKRRKAA